MAFAVLGAICVMIPGCGRDDGESGVDVPEGAIVRVDHVVFSESQLECLLPEGEQLPFTAGEKKRFIQRWVDTEALYQIALRRGIQNDPRIRARLRSLEQGFLADHLVFLELRERTEVTDDEIESHFNAHRREYLYEYRVSHILVNTLEEAEKLKKLLGTKSFAWVANRHSIDPVARRGGDLGYLTKGNMIPEFENVIFTMKAGEVSDIVKSGFGYHFIKLVGTRESGVKVRLDDVREHIMNLLMIEKREKAYQELIESIRGDANIEYFDSTYAPGPANDELPEEHDGDGEYGETD